MKQRFWNQLKSQLCALEDWQKDENQKKCHLCSKQFIPIFRRKHHCRLCGKIFCSSCSDYYINGKYLGLSEKYVRHCQFCRQKIEKIKKDCHKLLYLYDDQQIKSESSEDDYHSSDQQDYLFNIRNIFGEKSVLCQLGENLDDQIKEKSLLILKNLEQMFAMTEIQSQRLIEMAMKAVIQSKIELLPDNSQDESKDYMDILKHIKIKAVRSENNECCRLVRGITLNKVSFAKKLIRNSYRAKVMIIQNSIDIDSLTNKMKFEDLITNEKLLMEKLLKKIVNLNLDMIFVQKNVNISALEYLQERHVSVVSKVRLKDIEEIMRLTGIRKAVKNIWLIQKYKPQNIIGICDQIYFQEYNDSKTLLFLEKDVGIRSFLLFHKNQSMLSPLKKALQILLKCLKQMQLEKYLFLIDTQIREESYERNLPILIAFNRDIYDSADLYLQSQQISFNLLTLRRLQNSQIQSGWIQYGNKTNKNQFFDICGKIQEIKKKTYSNGDITIGAHILYDAQKYLKPCQKCKMKHTEYFYFKKNVIKIWYEQNLEKSMMQVIKEEEDFTLQKLRNYMKKHKENFAIFTYFECLECLMMFGNKVKVGKNYLKNSFYHVLALLSKLDIDKFVKRSTHSIRQSTQRERCSHFRIVRVLQSSDIKVKMAVTPLEINRIQYAQLKSQKSQLIRTANSQKFMRETIFEEIKSKKQIIDSLLGILNKRNFGPSSPLPKGSKTDHIQYYLKLENIMQILNQQLQEIQSKEKTIKDFDQSYDWTVFTRKIYKIQNVLKSTIDILLHLEQQIYKSKIDQPIEIIIEEEKTMPIQQSELSFQEITKDVKNLSLHKQKSQTQDRVSTRYRQTITIKKQTILSLQSEQNLIKLSKKVAKQRFPQKEGTSYLFYNIAYEYDPVSVLACVLNSAEFIRYHEMEVIPEELRIKQKFYRKIKSNWAAKAETDKLYHQIFNQDDQKSQIYEIIAYYHKQFEKLRVMEGISFEKYVKSLCGCRSWDTSGGKSSSKFAKSHDQTLVVKIIKQKQFDQFHKFAKSYLKFILEAKAKNMDSLLAKIFGIYEVTMGQKEYKCIVMQNIFFGISKPLAVYDLKGSQVNRCAPLEKEGKNFTGLDTNFKIDKECRPYVLPRQEYSRVVEILQNDALFLKEQKIIDYSLLVVEDHGSLIRIGIIDFMRPYYFMEKIENLVKEISNKEKPTVIPPEKYAERFINSMKRYFIKLID